MVVIIVIALLLIATVFVNGLLARRPEDTEIVRHTRALERLEELAREPRPPTAGTEPEPLSDHIRILDAPPNGTVSARRRRRSTRRYLEIDDVAPATVEIPPLYVKPPPPVDVPPAIGPPPAASRARGRPIEPFQPEPQEVAPELAVAYANVPPAGNLGARRRRRARPALLGAAAAIAIMGVAGAAMAAVSAGSRDTPNRVATEPAAVNPPPVRPPLPTTTTTALPSAQLAAAPNGNGVVTVRAPFTVALTTTAPCWVNVRSVQGQVLFEGTLAPGQQQQFNGSGPLVVRLGNRPGIQFAVNGTPLDLSALGNTTNLTVGPSA